MVGRQPLVMEKHAAEVGTGIRCGVADRRVVLTRNLRGQQMCGQTGAGVVVGGDVEKVGDVRKSCLIIERPGAVEAGWIAATRTEVDIKH